LELLKEPEKQQATMTTLDFVACLANGDRALPLLLQAVLLFLQQDVGQVVTGSPCDQGASDRKRLSPHTLGGSATSLNTPESVRLPSHSISPNSTVTKY
jgi:hypothetical protein